MQKINQLKAEIADTIKESTEYKEYKRLEAIVNMDPNLKRSIDEFRRKNYEIQNSGQVEDIFAAQEELNNQYKDMRNQYMVNRYLLAEVCLCRMVQDICRAVVDSIDFDLDFLSSCSSIISVSCVSSPTRSSISVLFLSIPRR